MVLKRNMIWIVGGALLLLAVAGVGWMAQFEGLTNEEPEKAPLTVGSKAPDFALPASPDGKVVRLPDFKGKSIILVFYPMDNTPGCTIQLCRLRDTIDTVTQAGAVVLASNPGTLDSHQQFAKRQKYPFPILVDSDHTMAKAYHADKMGFNIRTVYVIDGKGVIQLAERGMVDNDKLLETVKSLQGKD